MDGRQRASFGAVHDAEARSRTAEQAPHVRAQGCASSARPPFGEHRREVEPTGSRRDRHARAQWFWRLLPKQKSPARGSERNQNYLAIKSLDAGLRRHDEQEQSHWITKSVHGLCPWADPRSFSRSRRICPACAGMTKKRCAISAADRLPPRAACHRGAVAPRRRTPGSAAGRKSWRTACRRSRPCRWRGAHWRRHRWK